MSNVKCYVVMAGNEGDSYEWPHLVFRCRDKAEEYIASLDKREFCPTLEERYDRFNNYVYGKVKEAGGYNAPGEVLDKYIQELRDFEQKLLDKNPGRTYDYYKAKREFRVEEVVYGD